MDNAVAHALCIAFRETRARGRVTLAVLRNAFCAHAMMALEIKASEGLIFFFRIKGARLFRKRLILKGIEVA